MANRVHVFVVEDDELAKRLIDDHFSVGKNGITYALVGEQEDRAKIVDALNHYDKEKDES